MKAFAAVLLLALLACADARSMLKKTTATAGSVAYAADGSSADATAKATAKDGGKAVAGSLAAADDGSSANADSTATAEDDSSAAAGSIAYADYWSDAKAKSTATADDESKALAAAVAAADKESHAKATSTATADDDSKAVALGVGYATKGSYAIGKADAEASDDSIAKAVGLATATKWGHSQAAAKATADDYSTAVAKSVAKATNDGHASSSAVATGKYGGDASAVSKAIADGGSSHATATADATGYKDYYYGHYGYYYGHDDSSDDDVAKYYPYYYKPDYYHAIHYGYYVPKVEETEEEETPVHYYDPALVAYYTHLIYDFGCYEGKHYRCKYDESCGKCPYGHFCGSVTKNVCKEVSVWVKKCEKEAPKTKKCVPVLTPCGTDFCKYNQKCATDYFWCKAPWCEPKYHCVDVEAPKKCVFVVVADEYGFEKKVEKCTDYVEEACEAGQPPCAIGYACSADPCTYIETKVKKCADEEVPVCMPYDVPTYKDLYEPCGPGFCHPGYVCEAFEHKSCVKPIVVVKPEEPKYIHILPIDVSEDSSSDDDLHILPIPHKPCYGDDCDYYVIPHPDKDDTKSTATASATSVAGPDGAYSNVDVSATGDGVATGHADAKTEDSSAWSTGVASEDKTEVKTGAHTDGGKAVAKGTATHEGSDDK